MARPAKLGSITYSVKINGAALYDFGILVANSQHLSGGPIDIQSHLFPERHEAFAFSASFQPRTFVLNGTILADSAAQLRTNVDALKRLITPMRGNQYSIPNALKVEFVDHTDRYYPCAYPGGLMVAPMGNAPGLVGHATFTLPLQQLTPFALANDISTASDSGAGPMFQVLQTGSAPCPFIVELEGAATAPDFVIADMSFYADFNRDLAATIIDGTTVAGTKSGAGAFADQFEPGDHDYRYIAESSFATSFAGVVSNPAEGSVILVIRPQFAYDVAASDYLFEYYIDGSNSIIIYYDTTNDNFYFIKKIGAAAVTIGNVANESFTTDTYMVVAITWGADGMFIYKDGAQTDTTATVTGVTGSSGTVYLGHQAATGNPSCKYDYAAMFPFQLSADDILKFSQNPQLMRPYNVKKSKAGNIAANARSVLDFGKYSIDLLAAAGGVTNDLSDWDTNGFPMLRPNQMCFYVPTGESINGVKLAWRNRYL